ncbi:MAG: flagellar basal body rod protein FlgC [Verrucomicrobia bacterium]|jgi:flagellar basal-body rod protein FlgC|nr:flagellar basal body rod protein FlgC [Verrucomicrobiota bacterium]
MIQLIPSIQSTRSALDAERTRVDIVSQNLANANVTRGADGQPYKRKQVVFESLVNNAGANANSGSTIRVTRVESDNRPFREVFKPDHPDADARGYVRYPNVNVHEEMVDLIASSRAFEANIAVVKNARQLAQQAMSIGKR